MVLINLYDTYNLNLSTSSKDLTPQFNQNKKEPFGPIKEFIKIHS